MTAVILLLLFLGDDRAEPRSPIHIPMEYVKKMSKIVTELSVVMDVIYGIIKHVYIHVHKIF